MDTYEKLAHEALQWFDGWLKPGLTEMDKKEIEHNISDVFRKGLEDNPTPRRKG